MSLEPRATLEYISLVHTEGKKNSREKQISVQFITLKTHVLFIFGADLQRVRPVASGPVGNTQSGDGVASINLWLWCKPALFWWRR